MQVDPIIHVWKAPRTMRLQLTYGKLLSSFAFKSNLRRYAEDLIWTLQGVEMAGWCRLNQG